MGIGLASNVIARELEAELDGLNLDPDQVGKIVQAIATAIEKNNQEIDRELGRRFANIERQIGRR